jgi:hypothetical protein
MNMKGRVPFSFSETPGSVPLSHNGWETWFGMSKVQLGDL